MDDRPYLPPYSGPTVTIEIAYYPPLYEEAALLLARQLFAELDLAIAALTLRPLAQPEFAVWMDGELVHSLRETGRPPVSSRCLAHARTRLGPRAGDDWKETPERPTDTSGCG